MENAQCQVVIDIFLDDAYYKYYTIFQYFFIDFSEIAIRDMFLLFEFFR